MKHSPYDVFFKWLIQHITPEEILAFQMPQEARDRIQEIINLRSAGEITSEDEAELQLAVDFEDMILHIKTRAHILLNNRT